MISNHTTGHDGYCGLQQTVWNANQHKPPFRNTQEIPPDGLYPKHLWMHEQNLKLLESLLLPSDLKSNAELNTSPEDVKTLQEFYKLLRDVLKSMRHLVQGEDHVLWKWIKCYEKRLGLHLRDANRSLTEEDKWKKAPGPHSLQKVPNDTVYKPSKPAPIPDVQRQLQRLAKKSPT